MMNLRTRIVVSALTLVASASSTTIASRANPGVQIGCNAAAINASIHKGAGYDLFVTNSTATVIPAGTLINWNVHSPNTSTAGGLYLATALAPRAYEFLVSVPIPRVATLQPGACAASTASTFSAPGYGSGNGGPSRGPGKPVVHAQ